MSDRDIDAEFDAIVAHWDDDTATPPPPRTVQDITAAYAALSRPETDPAAPVAEPPAADRDTGAEPPADAAADTGVPTSPAAGPPAPKAPPRAWSMMPPTAPAEPRSEQVPDADAEPEAEAWRQGPGIDDEDDHFEPPEVQLPPGEDLGYWGAFLGLIGGPLLLLWVVVTEPFYGGWWTLGAILMFFGGFALLVMRDPHDGDPYSGDDGARV
jgi:hypothetical protein